MDSEDSGCSQEKGYGLLQPKEKAHGAMSERNQVQASRVLSQHSHTGSSDSSSDECDKCKMLPANETS